MMSFCSGTEERHCCQFLPPGVAGRAADATIEANNNNNHKYQLIDTRHLEKEMAEQVMQLSRVDLNDIQKDLHGDSHMFVVDKDESQINLPAMPEQVGEDILKAIQQLPTKHRKAYDQAVFLSPAYVQNQSFVEKFWHYQLASRASDPIAGAAQQIANHFAIKEQWFGVDALGREITQDLDFSDPENKAFLQTGGCQLMPCSDRYGRPIMFVSPMQFYCNQPRKMFRKLWYLLMDFVQYHSPTVQGKGIIIVFWFLGHDRLTPIKFLQMSQAHAQPMFDALPVRLASLHACYNDVRMLPLLNVLPKVAHWYNRLRFRSHYGSDLECRYALQAYGVPADKLPILSDAESSLMVDYYQKEFLPSRLQWERRGEQAVVVIVPTCADVLMGRGRRIQSHPGNRALGQLVQERYHEFQACKGYGQRKAIVQEICQEITSVRKGRFLKQETSSSWQVVTDEKEIYKKIAVVFRTHTKLQKRRQEQVESRDAVSPAGGSKATPSSKRQKIQSAPAAAAELKASELPLDPVVLDDDLELGAVLADAFGEMFVANDLDLAGTVY